MAVSDQVDVTGTATKVVPARDSFKGSPGARNALGSRFVTIKNLGPATAFIGGFDVTIDNGVSVLANGSFNLQLAGADEIWAVTAGSTTTMSFIETGGAVV